MRVMERIGLGTVQMGLDYGVSNNAGKVPDEEAARILVAARDAGLQVLDTASQYGDSEAVLGRSMPMGHKYRIVTKTPVLGRNSEETEPRKILHQTFLQSLRKLGVPQVYGLLVHNMDDLRGPHGESYIKEMQALRETGYVEKIGVSVYRADDIDFALSRFTPEIVQLPINIADQRLLTSGHIRKLKDRGVEIHARSLFLQGLLLMDPDCLQPCFSPLKSYLKAFHKVALGAGLGRLETCLSFGLSIPEIDCLIIGVISVDEFKDLVSAVSRAQSTTIDFESLAMRDETFLNPANWKSGT